MSSGRSRGSNNIDYGSKRVVSFINFKFPIDIKGLRVMRNDILLNGWPKEEEFMALVI